MADWIKNPMKINHFPRKKVGEWIYTVQSGKGLSKCDNNDWSYKIKDW